MTSGEHVVGNLAKQASQALTSRTARRNQIEQVAVACREHPGAIPDDVAFEEMTFHHTSAGVYLREFRMPAGSIIVGRVHKRPCLNVLMKGKLEAAMSEHEENVVMEAPHIFESGPGEQKALAVLEDAILVTCHATNETDPDALVKLLSVADRQEYIEYRQEVLEDKS